MLDGQGSYAQLIQTPDQPPRRPRPFAATIARRRPQAGRAEPAGTGEIGFAAVAGLTRPVARLEYVAKFGPTSFRPIGIGAQFRPSRRRQITLEADDGQFGHATLQQCSLFDSTLDA